MHYVECELAVVVARHIHSHLERAAIKGAAPDRKDLSREHSRLSEYRNSSLTERHGKPLCVPMRYFLSNRDVF